MIYVIVALHYNSIPEHGKGKVDSHLFVESLSHYNVIVSTAPKRGGVEKKTSSKRLWKYFHGEY